ncbi:MAG: hypothetical protein B6D44_16855 [Ignavibacteriales bacterium UTCHB2]|jgi:thiol-disulfide isomerase/thioredoxin|nr:hypothetical protein [Chitinophagaceae bacterium]OQY69888.1 MAG: hypothetical protein B6D44_16855 [Ignavibacteriales bacterium UTCHB2]
MKQISVYITFHLLPVVLFANSLPTFISGKIYHSSRHISYLAAERFQYSLQRRELFTEIHPYFISKGVDSFSINVECEFPQVIMLFFKDIFIKPGDSIKVNYFYNWDEKGMKDSLDAESKYPLDILFYEKLNKNEFGLPPQFDDKKYFENYELYKRDLDSFYRHIHDYLVVHKKEISNEFLEYLQNDLLFKQMDELCSPVESGLITRDKLPNNYFSLFSLLQENESKFIYMTSYCVALRDKIVLLDYKGDRNKLDFHQFSTFLEEAAKRENGVIRDYLLFHISIWCFNKASPEVIREVRVELEKYLGTISNTDYRIAIEENYPFQFAENTNRTIEPRIGEILVKNYSGNIYPLKDILGTNGQMVYLDIWSTSCLPCLKEIPLSLKLFEERYGKNILNIYLAIDEDISAWKKLSRKLNIPLNKSYVLFKTPDDQVFEEFFKILSFPQCILIKDRTIINEKMPHATRPDLLENELNYQMKKNYSRYKPGTPPPPGQRLNK